MWRVDSSCLCSMSNYGKLFTWRLLPYDIYTSINLSFALPPTPRVTACQEVRFQLLFRFPKVIPLNVELVAIFLRMMKVALFLPLMVFTSNLRTYQRIKINIDQAFNECSFLSCSQTLPNKESSSTDIAKCAAAPITMHFPQQIILLFAVAQLCKPSNI